jgi:hypothetical protein
LICQKSINGPGKKGDSALLVEEDEAIIYLEVLVITDGMPLSEGFVLSDGTIFVEGLVHTVGMTLIDGFILTNGTPLNEG